MKKEEPPLETPSSSSVAGQALPVEPPVEQSGASTGNRAGAAVPSEAVPMELTATEEPQDDETMGVAPSAPLYRGSRIISYDQEAMIRREKHRKFVQSCSYADSMYGKIAELTLPEKDE